jgi:hypothetical protein
MGSRYRDEAECFLNALRERFPAVEPGLRPEKTRLTGFGRFAAENRRIAEVFVFFVNH